MADSSLHMSVLSLGEIRKGLELLPEGPRKERLRLWLEQELPAWFGDSLLAATALHHDLRLVTRNVSDFAFPCLYMINPWEF